MASQKSAIPIKRNSHNPPKASPQSVTFSVCPKPSGCTDPPSQTLPTRKSRSDQENLNNNSVIPMELDGSSRNLSVSSSKPCSNSSVCRSNVSLTHTVCGITASINLLKEKTLKRIFSYLNYSDLIQCRAVKKYWQHLISKDEKFLNQTVYVVNIQKTYNVKTDTIVYNDMLQWAELPFRHSRFQFIDHHFFKEPQYFVYNNSDNEKYFPRETFIRSLSSLEIRNSFLLWSTLKRILIKAVVLDTLKISNCYISEEMYSSKVESEFEDFAAGNTVFGMRTLEIHETRSLRSVTVLLKKFTGYENQSLSTLKIVYYPPVISKVSSDRKSEEFDFCRELKTLLLLCANSLEVLILDIQHEATLDLIGYHLSKELEALGSKLNLKEFQLSPSLGVWLNKPELIPKFQVAMSMKSMGAEANRNMKIAATSLARFLETQQNLQKLGLPCLEYPEAYSACFKSVLERLPCAASLQILAVPCAGFLPENVFHRFLSLKTLKVGVSCCDNVISFWNTFNFNHYNNPNLEQTSPFQESEWELPTIKMQPRIKGNKDNVAAEPIDTMKNIEVLCLTTVESPENFSLLVKGMTNLTSLEVNSSLDTPVLNDEDVQTCVKYLKNLKSLVIARSESLTDYGITGISEYLCQLMFKLQKYHMDGINPNIWKSPKVKGRPLSDLKGLRKLVLMGSCSFTDIGIGYGLAFSELQYCHLPYSDTITSWGIERLGQMNPSIESLLFSGVNQMMKKAFLKLKNTHDRIKSGDTTRSGFFFEQESPFKDDFSLILPSPPEVVSTVFNYFAAKVHTVATVLRGLQSHPDDNPVNEKLR